MTSQEVLNVVSAVVLSVGGGGLLVFALSSWLGKVWATRILEKERSQYARELEALRSDYTRDVESLKADLARRHFDFQTRFAFYYQQRAEAIMTLYGALDMAAARLRDDIPPVLKELEIAFRDSLLVPAPSDAQLAHPAERAQRDSVPSS